MHSGCILRRVIVGGMLSILEMTLAAVLAGTGQALVDGGVPVCLTLATVRLIYLAGANPPV